MTTTEQWTKNGQMAESKINYITQQQQHPTHLY